MKQSQRPKLAVWKFASCDGCQLALLNCEAEFLSLVGVVDFANFAAVSGATLPGPYDISLVEGSITTPRDAERIHRIRRNSKHLIAMGACATAGGLQALRNGKDVAEWLASIYATPEYLAVLKRSTPISEHVAVDYEMRGCPVDKQHLLDVLTAFISGRKPTSYSHSVCMECKFRGVVCVMVANGMPCMGPVTSAGCSALCPSFGRGCFGCYGPKEAVNTTSLTEQFSALGMSSPQIARAFSHIHSAADAFRRESEQHGE